MKPISWAAAPVLAIGCAAIANVAMIVVSFSARPDVANVRQGSGTTDAGIAAQLNFLRSGASLSLGPIANGIRLTLSGGDLHDVAIICERPSDARLDRKTAWTLPADPLDVALPARGRWSVLLTATDAAGKPVEHRQEAMLP